MLMNHPEQFDRVAREWAVKHAGAPKSLLTAGGASYTHSAPSKPKTQKSKEQEMREQIARYDNSFTDEILLTHNSIGIKGTIRTSLTALSIWGLKLTEWLKLSTLLASTGTTVKITSSKKHTWEISQPASLESREWFQIRNSICIYMGLEYVAWLSVARYGQVSGYRECALLNADVIRSSINLEICMGPSLRCNVF
jgi:hypothetical protein